MNAYDRPTDSLPISRRTVIMNTGLAAAAIAGLSSCTNYSTAPAASHLLPAPLAAPQWVQRCSGPLTRQGSRHTGRQRQDLSRRPDGDHPAKEG